MRTSGGGRTSSLFAVGVWCRRCRLFAGVEELDAIALIVEDGAIGAGHVVVPAVLAIVFRCGDLIWLEIVGSAIEVDQVGFDVVAWVIGANVDAKLDYTRVGACGLEPGQGVNRGPAGTGNYGAGATISE